MSKKLAEYVHQLVLSEIPQDVRQETKRMLLDTIGCIIAARSTEVGPIAAAAGALFGSGSGSGGTATGNAYLYGRLADAMDFNEGYQGAHFGCGAVGAALGVAKSRPVGGEELLLSIAAGFEVGGRIMDAIGPYYTAVDGKQVFSPIWGIAAPIVYASVASTGKLLRLDPSLMVQAFGLAGSNTPVPIGGKWSEAIDLPNTKYCDSGWCTVAGLAAAHSAASGSTGLTSLFDDSYGFYTMLSARHSAPELLDAGLGDDWRVRRILYKEWPCCGLIAGPMRNLMSLLRSERIELGKVESIVAEVGAAILKPRFVNTDPRTFVSLQFSLPHGLAMLLLGVPPGPAWLSRRLADAASVRELRDKIVVAEHRQPWPVRIPGEKAGPLPSAIRIGTKEREYISETLLDDDGTSPDPRPKWDDSAIVAKFRSLVEAPCADMIVDIVMELEKARDLSPLLEAIDQARAYIPDAFEELREGVAA